MPKTLIQLLVIVMTGLLTVITLCYILFCVRNSSGIRERKSFAAEVYSFCGSSLSETTNSLQLNSIFSDGAPYMLKFHITFDKALNACVRDDPNEDFDDARAGLLVLIDNNALLGPNCYSVRKEKSGGYDLRWNTTFAHNGSNQLHARLVFPWPAPNGIDGAETSIVVSNIIRWDYDLTGVSLHTEFDGYLDVQSANYELAVYDTNMILRKSIYGHTDHGEIDEFWDMGPTDTCALSGVTLNAFAYITPTVIGKDGSIASNSPTVCVPYP